jgi:hypothetical protein
MPATPSQHALTLLFPIKKEFVTQLRNSLINSPLGPGLDIVGTVHFARIFVFAPNNPAGIPSNMLAVITSYDGNFNDYVQAFVNQPSVATFFNELLNAADIPGAAGLVPVQQNADAFAALVQKYDVTNPANPPWGEWYSAYPTLSVQNILHPN